MNSKPDNNPARALAGLFAVTMTGACATSPALAPPPAWSFTPEMVFPSDSSLACAEDGVALPDRGRWPASPPLAPIRGILDPRHCFSPLETPTMSDTAHQRVRRLFDGANELPTEARDA